MTTSSSAPPGPCPTPVPIPPTARALVQNLKEIVKNHSDDEIYAVLKESLMDPDEAVHKLMHQDTFHEVKRKRDRKKEHGDNSKLVERKERILGSQLKNRVDHVRRNLMNDSILNKEQDQTYRAAKGKLQLRGQQFKSSIFRPSNRSNARIRPVARNGRQQAASQATRKTWTRVSVRSMRINPKQSGTVSATVSSLAGDVSESVKSASSYLEASNFKQEIAVSRVEAGQVQESHVSDEMLPVSTKSNHITNRPAFERTRATGSGTSQSRARYFSVQRNKIAPGGRAPANNHYRKVLHQSIQQTQVVSRRGPSGLQWKPKPSVLKQAVFEVPTQRASEDEVEKFSSSVSLSVSTETPKPPSPEQGQSNLEEDDRPVIIPAHLQVPEAESAGLSFGSLDMDFEVKFASRLNMNDRQHVNTTVATDILSEQQTDSNVTDESTNVETVTTVEALPPTTAAEMFVTSNDAVLSVVSEVVRPSEISKPESLVQQGRHVSYVQTLPNYQGFAQPQYPYESGESQSHGVLRLPNFVPSFTDPTANYFSPVFHPGSDADARHQFLSSNSSSKFSGNVSLTSGQTLSSSQEVSQNAAVSHSTTLAMGQPSLQVHAYAPQPAAVTISPYGTNVYGYQYMPPNYAFMPTPNCGNNGYPQPPIGSSFTSGARGYPPVGTATLKYPATQYKLGTTNTPHALVATGYGGFATPSGFTAINSTVSASSGSSYDDMIGSQYKDNSLYTSSHQMEGSAVWVQAPLSRDPSGIQTNSYYNLHAQGQHAGYTHTQPTHAHPGSGFANYAQSGAGPTNHQLLQQPLALGSVGIGSHSVIFPSSQRGQVNWTNNYSARNQQ